MALEGVWYDAMPGTGEGLLGRIGLHFLTVRGPKMERRGPV
jgi:hypothetical protein